MNYIKLNRRSGLLTLSSVFLLLIAGGVVRSTGSGMGCPDWPKCYGAWFPPVCSCELPNNYQEIYVQKRIQKAKKFAKVLAGIGFVKQSEALLRDPNLLKPEIFNPLKAWTEYINRLIGVLTGLFSLVFFLSLLRIRKYISNFKFWCGVIGFIMMLFNAWLGSIVVATNLFPIIISIHYLATYAVLALFMFSLVNARIDEKNQSILPYKWYFIAFVFLSLVQVVYGTQLREVSDLAVEQNLLFVNNELNFDFLGRIFKTHWILAMALILVSLVPMYLLRKKLEKKWLRLLSSITAVLLVQYISGVINLRYSFPLLAQVSHIFFAGLIFGITLYICIAILRAPKNSPKI
jgi:cytochrome c oxidase assembly protein subunit 15